MKKIFSLNKKTFLWTILIFSVVVFAILAVWTFNLYPVAFANYRPIMAYTYYNSVNVSEKYYGNMINMSDAANIKTLRQAVLQGLIDEVAIDKRLSQDMTSAEVQNKIDSQTKTLISDPNVQKGLSQRSIALSDAEKYFFPIAIKNEILSGQLALENKDLTSWLVGARKDLKVVILLPGVHWVSGEVKFD
jgi:hypothetical protein